MIGVRSIEEHCGNRRTLGRRVNPSPPGVLGPSEELGSAEERLGSVPGRRRSPQRSSLTRLHMARDLVESVTDLWAR